ncbi:hypothetical protein QYE76_058386 [Lolium multiflorum]|uniref:Transposase (putative) gypsy type domain-containing protein n=1 Tax=Lolium multiflorum TaxID=4521 RepID=A0AAD8T544_LOLMU|nr:hypothetical protein QYE76_058386 [Lolium multiflorum]
MPPERYQGVFFFLALPLRPFSRSSSPLIRRGYSTVSLANFGERSPRRSSAELPPQLRQSGATGPRVSTARSSPPRSPPARSGSSSPFRLSWSSSSSPSSMAKPSGSWRGSYMREDDIERLVRLRRIPAGVTTRAPGTEMEPRPEPGERVVFGAHLDRGLGLPASNFFRRFLDFFGLQPHHLPANAIILLSCYVAFMEGYAGLWPDVEFWSRLFYIKAQTTEGRLRTCGAASLYPRTPAFDRLNLPEYNPPPPVSRLNWGHNPKSAGPDAEVNLLWDFLGECVTGGRLSAEDLLCTYVMRRVLPLQWRVHKIGHMSGRLDPTRTSKAELTKSQVARRVNNITKANMPENWDWGLPPYDREQPPELLFTRQCIEDGDLATKIWTPDHVDPADPAGDQAGDDLPEERRSGAAESGTGPIPAVPLRTRPPAGTATSAPKGKKRAIGGSTAAVEAKAKKQRRQAPKRGSDKVYPGRRLSAGSSHHVAASAAEEGANNATLDARAHAACCYRAACGYAAFCGGVLFSCAFRGAWRQRPGSVGAPADHRRHVSAPRPVCGAGGRSWQGYAACDRSWSWRGCAACDRSRRARAQRCGAGEQPGGSASGAGGNGSHGADCFDRAASGRSDEEERPETSRHAQGAGSRTLRMEGPSEPTTGLTWPGCQALLNVASASDSSLGSAGTMEKAWHQADACEVTSREGQPGVAPMKMFFSGFRGSLKAKAAETLAQLATLEDADKVVAERRTVLYNKVVTSYHKAKIERAGLARELEAAKAEAARVPQLESDLRVARAQCAVREEANRAAVAKLKVADGELKRLRQLEANHLKELAALKKDGEEKLEGLSKRLEEVERQRLALREEVTTKSNELSVTAKQWVGEISALDRGLAGESFILRLSLCRLSAVGCRLSGLQEAALAAVGRAREERRQATGEQSSDCFTMDDYLSSMAARVEPITKLGWELRKAAEELIRLLWPTETLPQDLSNLIAWLERAPDRFLDWKESAARAGADMALSFVLSWYNEVSLDQLEYRRTDVEDKLPVEIKTARLARACAIADFVDKAILIADPNPPSDDDEEEAEDVPEDDPAAGSADAPPAGPDPAGA